MKTSIVINAFAVLFEAVSAHYTFPFLLVNGTQTGRWQYVRDVGWDPLYASGWPPTEEFPKTPPQMELNATSMRCGREAEKSANRTDTATVLAGSELGFRVATDIKGAYQNIGHPGPGQIWLSKSHELERDIGDGEWFKIATIGPLNDTYWKTWVAPSTDVNFTIPKTTPPGKYLLRIEHFMPYPQLGYHQWYVNCAHISIVGEGGGTPTGFTKFPGAYEEDDPGIYLHNGMDQTKGLDKYVAPGPPIWEG